MSADTFPELEKLALNFNESLKTLNLKGYRSLRKVDACNSKSDLANTLMREIKLEGDYPRLSELVVNMTKLEQCDFSRANMPKLMVLSFSSNQLRSFEFPVNLQSIVSINLGTIQLTQTITTFRNSRWVARISLTPKCPAFGTCSYVDDRVRQNAIGSKRLT